MLKCASIKQGTSNGFSYKTVGKVFGYVFEKECSRDKKWFWKDGGRKCDKRYNLTG